MENKKQSGLLGWAIIVLSISIMISMFRLTGAWITVKEKEFAVKEKEIESITNKGRFMFERNLSAGKTYFIDTTQRKVWELFADPDTKLDWWGEMEFGKPRKANK